MKVIGIQFVPQAGNQRYVNNPAEASPLRQETSRGCCRRRCCHQPGGPCRDLCRRPGARHGTRSDPELGGGCSGPAGCRCPGSRSPDWNWCNTRARACRRSWSLGSSGKPKPAGPDWRSALLPKCWPTELVGGRIRTSRPGWRRQGRSA